MTSQITRYKGFYSLIINSKNILFGKKKRLFIGVPSLIYSDYAQNLTLLPQDRLKLKI